MILFTDKEGRVKDVNITSDPSLIPLEVNDDEDNPFKDWSVAKICCYKVEVKDGVICMMTPFVDSRLLEHIDQLGKFGESNAADISDARASIIENYEDNIDLRGAIIELYELITGGTE